MSSAGQYGDCRGMGGSDFPDNITPKYRDVDLEFSPPQETTTYKHGGAIQVIEGGNKSVREMKQSANQLLDNQLNKQPDEYKQITDETLKGGFKAASNKACMDLIPVNIFELAVHRILTSRASSKPYRRLANKLTDFWRRGFTNNTDDSQIEEVLLYEAFDEAFMLLSEKTGSDIKALFALGELYAIGKKKYAARNWEKGIDWGIVYSAAWRHLLHHIEGEETDPIDKQLHLTSILWNIVALIHYVQAPDKYGEFDTRKIIVRAKEKGQK